MNILDPEGKDCQVKVFKLLIDDPLIDEELSCQSHLGLPDMCLYIMSMMLISSQKDFTNYISLNLPSQAMFEMNHGNCALFESGYNLTLRSPNLLI